MDPIFETSFLGTRAKVFSDKVTYKVFFGAERIIPIKQISSVQVSMPGVQRVIVETTGGKRYKMVINLLDKEKFRDAILKLILK